VQSNQGKMEDICEKVSKLLLEGWPAEKAFNAVDNSAVVGEAINWPEVVEDLFKANAGWRNDTRINHRYRSTRFLQLFDGPAKSIPRSGEEVMRAYAETVFNECWPDEHKRAGELRLPPGSEGREKHFVTVKMILNRAVSNFAANPCWLPASIDVCDELIGLSTGAAQVKNTAPIKDPELRALLDGLKDEDPQKYLAVALVALHGLRMAELAVVKTDGEGPMQVLTNEVKRNAKSSKIDPYYRTVHAIDIPGTPGEGARVFQLWRSGLETLPEGLRNRIAEARVSGNYKPVGHAFGQMLRRSKTWRDLLELHPEIKPNSLRHSYAWRGHRSYPERPMPTRDLAKMMGHSRATHERDYGTWIDDSSVAQAVERMTGVPLATA